MKQKLVSIVLILCMTLCMFTACGKDDEKSRKEIQKNLSGDISNELENEQINNSGQVEKEAVKNSNKDEVKKFPEAIRAFKETYNAFYDKHRMNGNYMQPDFDCFANIYILNNTPIMLIMDIFQMSEDETEAYVDLYMFEYTNKTVEEKCKYTNLKLSSPEVYVYPLQEKLFVRYSNGNSILEYKVSVLDEYLEDVSAEYFFINSRYVDSNTLVEPLSFDSIVDNSYSQYITNDISYEDFLARAYSTIWFNTGLGKSGYAGNNLIKMDPYDDCGINFALVCENSNYFGLNSTKFQKYLDYLSQQEINNNAQLLVHHFSYLENLGVVEKNISDDGVEEKTPVIVWLNGVYYKIINDIAYPYLLDCGYSQSDLPEMIWGYEVRRDSSQLVVVDEISLKDIWGIIEIKRAEYKATEEAAKAELERKYGAALNVLRECSLSEKYDECFIIENEFTIAVVFTCYYDFGSHKSSEIYRCPLNAIDISKEDIYPMFSELEPNIYSDGYIECLYYRYETEPYIPPAGVTLIDPIRYSSFDEAYNAFYASKMQSK